jgi:hypothetical protein
MVRVPRNPPRRPFPFTSPLEGEVAGRRTKCDGAAGGGASQKALDAPPALTLPLKGGGDGYTSRGASDAH